MPTESDFNAYTSSAEQASANNQDLTESDSSPESLQMSSTEAADRALEAMINSGQQMQIDFSAPENHNLMINVSPNPRREMVTLGEKLATSGMAWGIIGAVVGDGMADGRVIAAAAALGIASAATKLKLSSDRLSQPMFITKLTRRSVDPGE